MLTQSLSLVWLFATTRTLACQAPLFMEFSRQEYGRELPFPPPEDLSDPGVEPTSPVVPVFTGIFFTTWEAPNSIYTHKFNKTIINNPPKAWIFSCYQYL